MAEWWAFKPISTAFEKTKKILLEPFNVWTWIKLMVIVFFVGTGTNSFTSQLSNIGNYRSGSTSDYNNINHAIQNILSNTALLMLLIGLVLLIILLVIVMAYLRNVFSFVFIQALATGDVRVIKPFMDNLGRGLRLFIFTILISLFTLVVAVVFIVLMVLAIILAIKIGLASIVSAILVALIICVVLVLLLLLIAFSILVSIFMGFTYDFVAPMVLFKNMGVFESWKSLWKSIKKDWKQYGVYVITRWVVQLGINILMLIIVLPVIFIFIAIFVVGVILAFAMAKTSILLAAFVGLLLLVMLIVFFIVMMAISVPEAVYLRYYSLDVLKQIDPSAITYSGRFAPPPPPQPQPTLQP